MAKEGRRGNGAALLPMLVFVVLYLGLGIVFEYVMGIEMGFYGIPIVVVFLIALGVACLQDRSTTFEQKLELMGAGIGDKNIVIMVLIFLEAGVFVGVVGRGSAQSVAYCLLKLIPPSYAVGALFAVACLVSLAMGTSVGTITLIVPIGVALAQTGGFSVPTVIGAVMSGAMFGDNLSFISDTTIAACNGQGCRMKDKFRENLWIALPAALVTLAIILALSMKEPIAAFDVPDYDLVQIVPYVIVLIGGIAGINVLTVLLAGIVSGAVIMSATGAADAHALITGMGEGVSGMFETAIVAVLVAALCALIRANGGFDFLLDRLGRVFKGRRGGQLGIGVLVALLDIATANNTVSIVIANPIAKELSEHYGISPRRTASLLDTFSCIMQGMLPYGAQMLVAISAAKSLDVNVSALQVIPRLYYPYMLGVCVLISILLPVRTRHAE